MTKKLLRHIRSALKVARALKTPIVFCVRGDDEPIVNRAIVRLGRRRVDPLVVLSAGKHFPGELMELLPDALGAPRGRVAIVGLAVTLPFILEALLNAHLSLFLNTENSAPGGSGEQALGTLAATTTLSPSEVARELRWPRALIVDLG